MTYQLLINHYRSQRNDGQVWNIFRISLGLLIAATLAAAYNKGIPGLSIINVILSTICLMVLFKVYLNRSRIPFIQIYEDSMEYFCQEEEQLVTIAAKDITEVSTRFCELRIHTPQKIHSLNMRLVKQEQTRWEIKEMIRQLTRTEHLPKAG